MTVITNKKGERIEQTTYFECSYWISSKVANLLTKGTLVELIGRVYERAWIGKDGEAHAGLNFHTSHIKVHGIRKRSNHSNLKSDHIPIDKNNNPKEDDYLPF